MPQPATTFALLRQHGACQSGYRKLARHLGGVTGYGRDKPIRLTVIFGSNGLDDTLWCLRATLEPCDREARLFATDCAKHVKVAKCRLVDDFGKLTGAVAALDISEEARYVVYGAAWDAAEQGHRVRLARRAEAVEQEWQCQRLLQYLTGKHKAKAA